MARKDFYHDPSAPAANSLVPAAAVAVVDAEHRVLLLRRRDNDRWTLPGGTMELNESLGTCAVREVLEETGFQVELVGVLGIYSDPEVRIAYSNGEVRREFTIVFIGRVTGGDLAIDAESHDAEWVALDRLDDVPTAQSQRIRLNDLREYVPGDSPRIR